MRNIKLTYDPSLKQRLPITELILCHFKPSRTVNCNKLACNNINTVMFSPKWRLFGIFITRTQNKAFSVSRSHTLRYRRTWLQTWRSVLKEITLNQQVLIRLDSHYGFLNSGMDSKVNKNISTSFFPPKYIFTVTSRWGAKSRKFNFGQNNFSSFILIIFLC